MEGKEETWVLKMSSERKALLRVLYIALSKTFFVYNPRCPKTDNGFVDVAEFCFNCKRYRGMLYKNKRLVLICGYRTKKLFKKQRIRIKTLRELRRYYRKTIKDKKYCV